MHPIELAAEAGDEFDEVVNEFFMGLFVDFVLGDCDGDAELVEVAFKI
jgi:hypothetical protein